MHANKKSQPGWHARLAEVATSGDDEELPLWYHAQHSMEDLDRDDHTLLFPIDSTPSAFREPSMAVAWGCDMAGDWIQMRSNITSDTKVLLAAKYLAAQPEYQEWLRPDLSRDCPGTVTGQSRDTTGQFRTGADKCVAVSVVVASLVRVWSAANSLGRTDGNDVIITPCTIDTLDDLADVPCFGRAMAGVGWAISETDASGTSLVRFPKFLLHNTPAEQRFKKKERDRKRRYRARNSVAADDSDASRDCPVVSRDSPGTVPRKCPTKEEKRIEELTPPTPSSEGEETECVVQNSPEQKKPAARPPVMSDYPHLEKPARLIADYYLSEVSYAHGPGRGPHAVLTLLVNGRTEAELRRSIEHFAKWFRSTGREGRLAPSVATFFSDDYWLSYLDGVPPLDKPQANPYLPENPPLKHDATAKLASKSLREKRQERNRIAQEATGGTQATQGSTEGFGSLPGAKFETRNGVHE